MKKIKVASLFSGCGGLDYGWHTDQSEVVFANDFNKHACNSYRKNYERLLGQECDHLLEGDINKLWEKIPEGIDVLLAGAPCQSWSSMGARRGFDDKRGNLFLKTIDIVKTKKPNFFVFENVKGLLSHDRGKSLDKILELIDSAGYDLVYRVVNFSEYGVHQSRHRVIMWGKRRDIEIDLNCLIPKKRGFTPFKVEEVLKIINRKNLQLMNSEYIESKGFKWASLLLPGENLSNLDDGLIKERYRNKYKKIITTDLFDKKPKGIRPVYRLDPNRVAPTMVFNDGTNIPWHPWFDRVITVREAATIQGFPLDFEFVGKFQDQYRQVANAVPPIFSSKLANQFIKTITNQATNSNKASVTSSNFQ